MNYDPELIAAAFTPRWEGDTCWFLSFAHGSVPVRPDVMRFVRSFRSGDPNAVELAVSRLIDMFGNLEPELRDRLHCRYVVASPGHNTGGANQQLRRVCLALGEAFSWLTPLPGALRRMTPVPRSAGATNANRPSFDDHLRSIVYQGPSLNAETDCIILVDDVLATGATSAACRNVLRHATTCEGVITVFLARVLSGPFSEKAKPPS